MDPGDLTDPGAKIASVQILVPQLNCWTLGIYLTFCALVAQSAKWAS